eukprot:SAG11_NODE_658_length_7897_cov_13.075789_2_plen_97_part_00
MLYYHNIEHVLSLGQSVTNMFSIIFGVLVLASATGWHSVVHIFGFTAYFIGRGVLYIFIGLYFGNVTSGGLVRCSIYLAIMIVSLCSSIVGPRDEA